MSDFLFGNKEAEERYLMHNKDRYELVMQRLNEIVKDNKKVELLDIGVSPLTFMLKKKYPKIKITALDYSDALKHKCLQKGIRYIKQDLNNGVAKVPNRKFDVILFLEVIEHLKIDHLKIIKDLLKKTKTGGYLIIQTPSRDSLKKVMIGVIGKDRWKNLSYTSTIPDEFEHVGEPNFEEMDGYVKKLIKGNLISSSYLERKLYFDTPLSTLAYRRYKNLLYPFLCGYYIVVRLMPRFRRGLYLELKSK